MKHPGFITNPNEATTYNAKVGDRVYLDYSAATPIDEEVLAHMLPFFDRRFGNASSIHTDGRRSRDAIEESRAIVSSLIGAKESEVIFTGSGTEADNLALLGVARANRARGNHLIISSIEHKAVLEAAHVLEREGFSLTVLPVDESGMISVEECMSHIRPETILISVMYVNNEIGTVLPVHKLADALRKVRRDDFPLLHTDACQASNLYSLSVRQLGVDLMTVNSSKLYGPVGVGFLYARENLKLSSVVVGGEQEHNRRAGTESVPQIVGLSRALGKAQGIRAVEFARLSELSTYFREELLARIPNIILNGDPASHSPAIVHVSVPFVEGESMLLRLDAAGISVSTGSACSAFDLRPSHVLIAIGQDTDLMHGSIRFSLGRHTTKDELKHVLAVFPDIVHDLRSISALTVTR